MLEHGFDIADRRKTLAHVLHLSFVVAARQGNNTRFECPAFISGFDWKLTG
jgi:hypothetical protein